MPKPQQSKETKFKSDESDKKRIFRHLNQNKKIEDIETLFSLFRKLGLSDGDKGDIIVSMNGQLWSIKNGSITDDKIVSVSADKVIQSPEFRFVTDDDINYWNSIEDNSYAVSITLG